MLQTLLLLMKSLNKTESPIFICNVFFVSKGIFFTLFDLLGTDTPGTRSAIFFFFFFL